MLVLALLGVYKKKLSKLFAVAIFHWEDVAEQAEKVKKEKKSQQEKHKKIVIN